jgi:hypothetical protein
MAQTSATRHGWQQHADLAVLRARADLVEALDRRFRGRRALPRPGRTSIAAVRLWLLALLSEQILELLAARPAFEAGLVFAPGLTGLQDSPDGCPAKRALPVQAHMLGDGSGSLQDRGRGRMAGGEEADVRARVADARDRIDGHIAGAGPQQVLVEEVSDSSALRAGVWRRLPEQQ